MTGFEVIASVIVVTLVVLLLLIIGKWEKAEKARLRLVADKHSLEKQLIYKISHIENITHRNRNSLVGARVICRSNENDPLWVGTLVCFQEVSQAKNQIPVVVDDNGKEWLIMGIVIPYNEKILAEVKDMAPKEQWDYMVENRLGLKWE